LFLVETPVSRPLSDITATGRYRISRVGRDEPTFLAYLKRTGLMPGQAIQVNARDDDAMTIHLTVGDHEVTMSLEIAGEILVEPTSAPLVK
jgi:Fe2+ transport system protein FeoA